MDGVWRGQGAGSSQQQGTWDGVGVAGTGRLSLVQRPVQGAAPSLAHTTATECRV